MVGGGLLFSGKENAYPAVVTGFDSMMPGDFKAPLTPSDVSPLPKAWDKGMG